MADKKEKVIVTGEPVADETPADRAPDRPYGPLEQSPIPQDKPVAPVYADEAAQPAEDTPKRKRLGVKVGDTVLYVLHQAFVNPLPVIPVTDVPPATPVTGIDRAAVVTHVHDAAAGTVDLCVFTRGPEDGQNTAHGITLIPLVGYDKDMQAPGTWHFRDDARDEPHPVVGEPADETPQQTIDRLRRELAAAKAGR